MSRNMIAANQAIFHALDRFAASGGEPLDNAGEPRWIATSSRDKGVLLRGELSRSLRISQTRSIARIDLHSHNFFVLFGFGPAVTSSWLAEEDVNAGIVTVALAELNPKPIASPLQIKEIVDAQDRRMAGYIGHSAQDIAGLFPTMRTFVGSNLAAEESDRVFFDFILSETQSSDNWIDEHLARDLRLLLDLKLIGIPYMTIARSMLDFDQSSLFMALYRCLESLYSHAGANRLREALNVTAPWEDVAIALESELNWRPIEGQSLEVLVNMGAGSDLSEICEAIKPAFAAGPSADPAKAAGYYLYKLRNSVVHYRPAHSKIDHSLVDWSKLCSSCTMLIAYVYSEVFGSL